MCGVSIVPFWQRLALVFLTAVVVAVVSGKTLWHQLDTSYTFDRYCAEFGKVYEGAEFAKRQVRVCLSRAACPRDLG